MHDILKNQLGYSDYEIKKIRYILLCIFSETSKIIIIGLLFAWAGFFLEFVEITLLFFVLRGYGGGLHFNHFMSCFIFSLAAFFCILLLNQAFPFHFFILEEAILFVCLIVIYCLSPITSAFRPEPDSLVIKQSKRINACFILLYALLVSIVPYHHFISLGIWTIIIHTLKLAIAAILKGGHTDEA